MSVPKLGRYHNLFNFAKTRKTCKSSGSTCQVFLPGSWNKRPRLDKFHCISSSFRAPDPPANQCTVACLGPDTFTKQSKNDRTRQNNTLIDLSTRPKLLCCTAAIHPHPPCQRQLRRPVAARSQLFASILLLPCGNGICQRHRYPTGLPATEEL